MSYRDNVTAAAAALKRGEDANWELARLTYESTSWRGKEKGTVEMRQWCRDIEEESGRAFSPTYAIKFRKIWETWGMKGLSSRPAWSEAMEIAWPGSSSEAREDRARERTLFGDRATPEVKRETFKRLAADPEVVDAAMQDREARTALAGAWTRHEQRTERRVESITDADSIARDMRGREAILSLRATCDRFAREVGNLLPQAVPLADDDSPGSDRYWFVLTLNRAREAVDRLEAYARTGKTDIDAFLSNVLGGSSNE